MARALPSPAKTVAVAVGIFVFSLVVALLPVVAIGPYSNTGDGFCYIDFSSTAQAAIIFVICLPTYIATLLLLGLARPDWPDHLGLWLVALGFASAWLLWLPASIIGLAGGSFPHGFFITGGILGHAQALINPYIYGVRWRAALIKIDNPASAGVVGKGAKVDAIIAPSDVPSAAPDVAVTPAEAEAATPPSVPPSPPTSGRHEGVRSAWEA